MTKEEFNTLNNFILEGLREKKPFITTTSRLFNKINYDIQFSKGHNALYDEFLKSCVELRATYNIEAKKSEDDEQFDIVFF